MKLAAGLVVVLAASAPVHAGYIGNVVGLVGEDQFSSLTVSPGDSFTGAVVLGGPSGTQSDFALLRLVFSVPNLEYTSGWYDWSAPFTTGGVDDFSSPSHDLVGSIAMDTFADPFAPDDIDVAFENVSDSFGDVFTTGTILTFTLTVPESFEVGAFTIDFAPDTFTDGAAFVDATAGSGLTVSVIPAPATGVFAGLGVLAICRRRR